MKVYIFFHWVDWHSRKELLIYFRASHTPWYSDVCLWEYLCSGLRTASLKDTAVCRSIFLYKAFRISEKDCKLYHTFLLYFLGSFSFLFSFPGAIGFYFSPKWPRCWIFFKTIWITEVMLLDHYIIWTFFRFNSRMGPWKVMWGMRLLKEENNARKLLRIKRKSKIKTVESAL